MENLQSPQSSNPPALTDLLSRLLHSFDSKFDRLAAVLQGGLAQLDSSIQTTNGKFDRLSLQLSSIVDVATTKSSVITPTPGPAGKSPSVPEPIHEEKFQRTFPTPRTISPPASSSVMAVSQQNSVPSEQQPSAVSVSIEQKVPVVLEPMLELAKPQQYEDIPEEKDPIGTALEVVADLVEPAMPAMKQVENGINVIPESTTPPSTETVLNALGQFRDKQIIISFGPPIYGATITAESTRDQIAKYISKWIGKTMNCLTKQAFYGQYSKQLTEQQTRVFLSHHLILHFHEMVEKLTRICPHSWRNNGDVFIICFQQTILKAIDYYTVKYPPRSKTFLSEQFRSLVAECNDLRLREHSTFRKLRINFNPWQDRPKSAALTCNERWLEEFDYSGRIKLLFNRIISQTKEHFKEFKELMKGVFTIRVFAQNSLDIETREVQHRIGMKFKQDMPLYSESELHSPGVDIKSPEVLRVIVKWIGELEAMVNTPQQAILEREAANLFNTSHQEAHIRTLYFKQITTAILQHRGQYLQEDSSNKSVINSALFGISSHVADRMDCYNHLPPSTIKSGITVNILSTLTSDLAVLHLKKLVAFLYKMHRLAYSKIAVYDNSRFVRHDQEILPFTISDLLRAKCTGTFDEIKKVIDNLQQNTEIKIVRIKNRLNSSNQDFLINFVFGECKVVCEVQVGLKSKIDQKEHVQHHFSHFLYQLSRSNFGPLSESAQIINNEVLVGGYFALTAENNRKKHSKLAFSPRQVQGTIVVDGFKAVHKDCKFLCGNCQTIYLSRLFRSWKKQYEDVYLCGECVYHKLDKKQKANYALGETGSFFQEIEKEQPSSMFIAVVEQSPTIKISYYCSYQRHNPTIEAELDHKQLSNASVAQHEVSMKGYYLCFQDIEQFVELSQLAINKKIFELRDGIQTRLLTLNCRVGTAAQVTLTPDNEIGKQVQEEKESEVAEYSVHEALSNGLKKPPTDLSVVRCAVDNFNRAVLALDYNRTAEALAQAERGFVLKKKNSKINEKWMKDWNYSKRQFTNDVFEGLPDNHTVEAMTLDDNLFTKMDFFRSDSLKTLSMNRNKIERVALPGFYPSLTELSLVGNNIQKVELGVLDQLQSLNLCNNRISKLSLVRPSEQQSSETPLFPSLNTLLLKYNQLESLCLTAKDVPLLTVLHIGHNQQLTEVDLTGFDRLAEFQAAFTSIERFKFEGTYPLLVTIDMRSHKLESLDLSGASTPSLMTLQLCYGRLTKMALPSDCQQLTGLFLGCNFIEQLEMNLEKSEYLPALSYIDVSWNRIQLIDLRELASTSLNNIDASYNAFDLQVVIPQAIPRADLTLITSDMPDTVFIDKQKVQSWRLFGIWKVQMASPAFLAAFKTHLAELEVELPSEDILQELLLTQNEYFQNMQVPKSERDHKINRIRQLLTQFKSFASQALESESEENAMLKEISDRDVPVIKIMRDKDGELEQEEQKEEDAPEVSLMGFTPRQPQMKLCQRCFMNPGMSDSAYLPALCFACKWL